MPDLGKYAEAVLSAYAASIVLIVALVAVSMWRSKKIHMQLQDIEKRTKKDG